jgi:glycosyltransferase involved in cell wall biosynthesis
LKRKVLIFIGSLTSGGAERVTVSLSKYLSGKKNYSVVVVTLNEKESDFYSLDKTVKRISMDMSGETKGMEKFLRNIQRVLAFRTIVKEEKPDIVVGMITRQAVMSVLACIHLPVKVITSERNYPAKRKNHTMWELLRKWVYRYADLHVVQTKKIADWLRIYTKSKDIRVIPNSATWPLPEYSPALNPANFLKAEDKIILAVGSLKVQKGFDLLIKAVSGFLHEYPEWKVVILGGKVDKQESKAGSEIRNQLQKMITDNDLEEQIIMPGRAGNIGAWYQRADIFVLSSRFEGFPNVLLEAMASGVSCVSFDCDTGPRDLIKHEENGLLVTPSDTEELQISIQRLMKDPDLRRNLSENAVKIRQTFSEEVILGKWSKVCEELLSSDK